MKSFKSILCTILIILPLLISSQNLVKDENPEISEVESRLIMMINSYRKINKLTEIPISKSLTQVSKIHASDLLINQPDTGICGLHSWSDKGIWTPCCETELATKSCFESKPAELTGYKSKSIEMVFKLEVEMTGPNVFQMIEKSPKALELILQKGSFLKKNWKALGVGIAGQYAIIWFGEESDHTVIPQTYSVTPAIINESPSDKKNSVNGNQTLPKPSSGNYYVTVRYSKTEKEAQAEQKKILKMGYSEIQIVFINKFFRLVFGPYPTMDEADKIKRTVNKDFNDAWIIKKDN